MTRGEEGDARGLIAPEHDGDCSSGSKIDTDTFPLVGGVVSISAEPIQGGASFFERSRSLRSFLF